MDNFSLTDLPILLLAVAAGLLLYFIPALVANGKRDQTAVFWLNLLAGWTFLGWVGALIWALRPDAPRAMAAAVAPRPTVADELLKLDSLREKGLLTAAEFDQQKARLLAS